VVTAVIAKQGRNVASSEGMETATAALPKGLEGAGIENADVAENAGTGARPVIQMGASGHWPSIVLSGSVAFVDRLHSERENSFIFRYLVHIIALIFLSV
jgi:hypothetical protein